MVRSLRRWALAGSIMVSGLAASSGLATGGCGGGGARTKQTENLAAKQKHERQARLVQKAHSSAKSGDVDAADTQYGKAFGIAQEVDILHEHVMFLIASGRATRAAEVAKAYYDANTTDPAGYELYAEALLAGNEGNKAYEVATQLVKFDDKRPVGYEKRGRAQVQRGNAEDGITDLQHAVELAPDDPRYHTQLGLAFYSLKRYGEAAIELSAAQKKTPDDSMANALLGMARRDQGFDDDAKTSLDRAVELDKRNGRAWFELGLLYNRQEKQTDAEDALAKAVQLSPYESRFWYAYGEIYRVQQRDDEAIAAYKRAIELDPPNPKVLPKLVGLYIEHDKLADADEAVTAAMGKFPDLPSNWLAAGMLYQAQKKKKPAIDAYTKFLSLAAPADPERSRATEAITALKKR